MGILVDGLPPEECEVINRIFWERMPLRDVARDVGKSVRSVRRIRDRAIARLRERLESMEEALIDASEWEDE